MGLLKTQQVPAALMANCAPLIPRSRKENSRSHSVFAHRRPNPATVFSRRNERDFAKIPVLPSPTPQTSSLSSHPPKITSLDNKLCGPVRGAGEVFAPDLVKMCQPAAAVGPALHRAWQSSACWSSPCSDESYSDGWLTSLR